jgi:high affinity sulfate transporter 1
LAWAFVSVRASVSPSVRHWTHDRLSNTDSATQTQQQKATIEGEPWELYGGFQTGHDGPVSNTGEYDELAVSGLARWIPGLDLVRRYRRQWLLRDVLAGLALTALLVPQGMAYAELAGLPAVTGLYTSVLALLAYAVFGPSRIMVVGPDSALGPMIAAAILPLVAADGDPTRAIALASILAFLMGAYCIVAGIVRVGTLAELFSRPMRVGYLSGLAIVVVVSQLPKLFGFSTTANGLRAEFHAFVQGISDGKAVSASLLIGVASLVAILVLRFWLPNVPGVFLAVVGATVLVSVFDLSAHGVAVLGVIPPGIPKPSIPRVGLHDMGTLALAALGMAFVTLADTSALSRSLAAKRGANVDQNQELIALGTANLSAGLFQGFPVSASATRTVAAESSGSLTQMTGVIGALCILVLLTFTNGLLQNLPNSVLAAIVIAAAVRLFDLATLRWLWRVRKSEFLLSLAALLGVAIFGVLPGIAIAVALSVGDFVRQAWRPHTAILGRIPGRKGYHDIERHPEAVQIPGLLIFRFDAPMFFANAEFFSDGVKKAIATRQESIAWIVLAAEPITDIDTSAVEALDQLLDDLEVESVHLVLAELKGPVKDRLRSYGLYERLGDDRFFATIGTAVRGYLDASGVEWVDWSDEEPDVGRDPPPDPPRPTPFR